MSRPPLLFSTYYRTYPLAQMGVFKRCVRLMQHLLDAFEIHVVNYGPWPEKEPLFVALRDRLVLHRPEGEAGPFLHSLMEKVKPRALILGEAPLRGAMRMAHRVGVRLGIPQIAIDNYYVSGIDRHYASEWPAIHRWLLLGLLEGGEASARPSPRVVVVPPLVRFPPEIASAQRDRIVILGYDRATLSGALSLLPLLNGVANVDFFVSAESRDLLRSEELRFEHRVIELPVDAVMYDALARASFVFGKAGYQQVVETLLLGAPIIVRSCGGGIIDALVADPMKPYVRVMQNDFDLEKMARDANRWLARPPRLPWPRMASTISDTMQFAAETVRQLIGESRQEIDPTPPSMGYEVLTPSDVAGAESAPLVEFKLMIEQRRWSELRQRMGSDATVWLFDRAAGVDEFVALLRELFHEAVDLKLITMAHKCTQKRDGLTHFSRTCTLIWGERLSWREHELDFDLHLGTRDHGGDWRIAYVGATAPTPENVGSAA